MLTRSLALALALSTLGCGASSSARREPASSPSRPRVTAEAVENTVLAPLRPAGSAPIFAALTAQPRDASIHARAAHAYATTDTSGMSLLWGATWGALGGSDAAEHRAVANAIATGLRDHIQLQSAGNYATSLAPGATPVISERSGMHAPIAHLLEHRIGLNVFAWDGGPWTLTAVSRITAGVATGTGPGSAGLQQHAEVLPWLEQARAAGHLDAFASWLVGPAFATEYAAYASTRASELTAMHAWVAAHPFTPTHAVLPDDLVTFP